MTAWEYFVAPLLEHNPGEILNTFGEDGWELVAVTQQQTPARHGIDGPQECCRGTVRLAVRIRGEFGCGCETFSCRR